MSISLDTLDDHQRDLYRTLQQCEIRLAGMTQGYPANTYARSVTGDVVRDDMMMDMMVIFTDRIMEEMRNAADRLTPAQHMSLPVHVAARLSELSQRLRYMRACNVRVR
jgi:hypothetical protein